MIKQLAIVSKEDYYQQIIKRNLFSGRVLIESPSNIALVKYWGKKDIQLPQNPSISLTLHQSKTQMTIDWQVVNDINKPLHLDFEFDGCVNESFRNRISSYLLCLQEIFPFVACFKYRIHARNTFPHSAGIASSASSFSAIAMGIASIADFLLQDFSRSQDIPLLASYLARYGSGSACRSIYPGYALWGKIKEINLGNDEYAVPIPEIHHDFMSMRDSILLIDSSPKRISSSQGHRLMFEHPYAAGRYVQAAQHALRLVNILRDGDWLSLGLICESEALSIHALMASSSPPYILISPRSLEVMTRIQKFRADTGVPVFFSLDAGPNVHLLYPEDRLQQVQSFIEDQLRVFLENGKWIDDAIGKGPTVDFIS